MIEERERMEREYRERVTKWEEAYAALKRDRERVEKLTEPLLPVMKALEVLKNKVLKETDKGTVREERNAEREETVMVTDVAGSSGVTEAEVEDTEEADNKETEESREEGQTEKQFEEELVEQCERLLDMSTEAGTDWYERSRAASGSQVVDNSKEDEEEILEERMEDDDKGGDGDSGKPV